MNWVHCLIYISIIFASGAHADVCKLLFKGYATSTTEVQSFGVEWIKFTYQVDSAVQKTMAQRQNSTLFQNYQVLNSKHHLQGLEHLGIDLQNPKSFQLIQILHRYNNLIQKIAEQKKIRPDTILKPQFQITRRVRHDDANLDYDIYQAASWGSPIPVGWRVFNGALEGDFKLLIDMLARGEYPMGGKNPISKQTRDYMTLIEHDLAHLTAFIQFPEYMVAIKRFANTVKDRWSQFDSTKVEGWLNFFLERLVIVKPEMRLALSDRFQLTTEFLEGRPNVERIKQALLAKPIPSLIKASSNGLQLLEHTTPIGGGSRDPLALAPMFALKDHYVYHISLDKLFRSHNSLKLALEFGNTNDALEGHLYDLAKAIYELNEMSFFSLTDWINILEASVRGSSNSVNQPFLSTIVPSVFLTADYYGILPDRIFNVSN